MTSTRTEHANPEGHIATLDAVSIELLLSMYAPQVRAMQQDIAKGYFFFEDLLGQFFERFQKHPVLEAEKMARFGLLQTPPEGTSIPANSVRISVPILRNWNAVLARAEQLQAKGERLKPLPARRSTSSLALDFEAAPLPSLTLPAADPSQISLSLLPVDASAQGTRPQAPSPSVLQAVPAATPPATEPASITDDPASLPASVQQLSRDFEEQLAAAPRKGAGDRPQTIDDVARITGTKGKGAKGKGAARG